MVEDFVSKNMNILDINRNIIEDINSAYIKDMNKFIINKTEAVKNEAIYYSIPIQIGNKSNKFQYSKIDKNARRRDYNDSLEWLLASKLVYKCCKLNSINIPPEAYKNNEFFKIYMGDVGILNTMLKMNVNDIYLNKTFLYKGEITENYVANQLMFNNVDLYYWAVASSSEIDFIIYNEDGIIPIEVKASENLQAKSLKSFIQKYNTPVNIRTSMSNYRKEEWLINIPLYSVGNIEKIINNN